MKTTKNASPSARWFVKWTAQHKPKHAAAQITLQAAANSQQQKQKQQ